MAKDEFTMELMKLHLWPLTLKNLIWGLRNDMKMATALHNHVCVVNFCKNKVLTGEGYCLFLTISLDFHNKIP